MAEEKEPISGNNPLASVLEVSNLPSGLKGKAQRIFLRFLAGSLGRVDKRDSQILLLLIQDCFLRISHGSRGFVGCGVGPDWAAAAA